MKIFLSLLLVCAVLGELTPERKDNLRKLTQVIKEMKELAKEGKKFENARKLQETDTTDGMDLDAPATNISKEYAGAQQNYAKNTTSTNYQIKGFYGFYQEKTAKHFTFGMIFSFIPFEKLLPK